MGPKIRILEIGCGTGALTEHLAAMFPNATIFATDASSEMLERTKARFAAKSQLDSPSNALTDNEHLPKVHFKKVSISGDGFHCTDRTLLSQEPFDLIFSSFVLQWFSPIEPVLTELSKLLKPGGMIGTAVPAEGSFPEWRRSCEAAAVPFTANPLPESASLSNFTESNDLLDCGIETSQIELEYDSPLAFFQSLKYTGASLQNHGVSAGANGFRKLIKTWKNDSSATSVTWSLIYSLMRKRV